MLPKAIIFDMDGVLVDSELIHWKSVVLLLDRLGIDRSMQPTRRTGWSDRDFWLEMKITYGLKEEVSELSDQREKLVLSLFEEEGLPAKEGVPELLKSLDESYPSLIKCVVSASPIAQIQASLSKNHLLPHFKLLLSGHDHSPRNKPNPDPYLHCLSQIGIAPSDAWIIEDSAPGLTGALKAGVAKVIAIPSPDCPPEIYLQASFVIHQMLDLKKLL
jgi:HAD superfamily hydrolase (TIGR01509 family)